LPWVGHPKPLSQLKLLVVPRGKRRRKILTGAFRGLTMEMELRDQTQLFLGLHEREVYNNLQVLARNIRTAIDVGAAEGEYTLFFLLRAKADRVVAVEPDADLREVLQRNLNSNPHDRGRVELCEYYVADIDENRRRRLDTIAASLAGPCLVKIDVDGGEVDVLRGAQIMLSRPDVRWLIETHSHELERECLKILSVAGHEARVITNAWWRFLVPENRPIDHNRWLVAWKR
jgi:hypothetical protein